jgi:hypothetical protein
MGRVSSVVSYWGGFSILIANARSFSFDDCVGILGSVACFVYYCVQHGSLLVW